MSGRTRANRPTRWVDDVEVSGGRLQPLVRLAAASLVATLLVLSPAVLLGPWRVGPSDLIGLAWLTLTVLVSSRLALLAVRQRFEPIESTFWCFLYVMVVVAGLLQLRLGSFPWPGIYPPRTVVAGFGTVIVGCCAYFLGFRLGGRLLLRHLDGVLRRPVSVRRLVLLSVLVVPGAALVLVLLGASLVSPRHFFVSSTIRDLSMPGYVASMWLIRIVPFVCFLGYCLAYRAAGRAGRRRRWPLAVGGLVTGLLAVVGGNPIIAPRFWLGTMLLSVLLLLPWTRFRYATALWITMVLLGLGVVFPHADAFRTSLLVDKNMGASLSEIGGSVKLELLRGNFDTLQQTMNAHEYVKSEGFRGGRQVAGAFLFWVPRDMWEGKPIQSGEYVASALGYNFRNFGLPLWSEGYIAGGWAGVIAIMAVFGLMSGWLAKEYRKLARNGCGGEASLLALVIFIPYQVFLIRGSLLNALAFVAPVIILAWMLGERGRSELSRSGVRV